MQQFTGLEYLKIDIANNFGNDKDDWDDRLAWFEDNKTNLMAKMKTAETPALYYAAVKAYEKAIAGKPSGYPVSLDATSSGLQILACLTGDRRAAEICNVVDVGHRQDAYTVIFQRMLVKAGSSAKIKRGDCKDAIMTALYGSKAVPKRVFGEGVMLHIFDTTMGESAPAVWELNKTFPLMWDSEALTNEWELPDNFHVVVKVIDTVEEIVHFKGKPHNTYRKVNQPTKEGLSLGANVTHSVDGFVVREMIRRCSYDPIVVAMINKMINEVEAGYSPSHINNSNSKMVKILMKQYERTGYLSARILDHLDYDNIMSVPLAPIKELLASLPVKPFTVVSVHDCFRCLPNYANDLRKQYNNQLYLIAKSHMLSAIVSQLLKRPVEIEKLDPTLHEDILDSNYALS